MKKIYQYFLKSKNKKFYFIIYIIIIFLIIINNSFIQNKIAKHILFKINKSYDINILIDNISINFIVGNIKIKNIQILDKKNNRLISIPRIEGNINIFDFFFRKININNLIINNPKINIITYKNDSISNITYFIKCFQQKNYTNSSINNLSIKNFYIKKAYIHIINNNKYINLIFKGNFNYYAKKIIYNNKLIQSYISNLMLEGAYMNKNININFNTSKLMINNKKLISSNNNLIFNKSKIFSYFSFYYNKYEDLLNFNQKVFLYIKIYKKSYISSNDINLLIKNNFLLKKSFFYIECIINGILNKNINILNIHIKNGKNIIKSKRIILLNIKNNIRLFLIKNTFIETSFFDIKKIFTVFFIKKIPIVLNNYGQLRYYGSINISSNYININGYFKSSKIGFFRGKIFFFNFKKLKNIEYKGKIYININNLYPLLEIKNFKDVNAEFIFYGKGYELKNINIKLNLIIKNIFLYNRKIKNININGYIFNNCFYGIFYINDNNINIKFNGKIFFYPKKYFLYGKIKLKYFNFDFINKKFYNKSIYGKNINININFIKLNNFKLNIYLNNIYYKFLDKIIYIPNIYFNYKSLKEGNKFLTLSISELINLSFFGHFKWIELYPLLINNINKLLNNKEYYLVSSNQFLFFKIKINYNILNFFNKKINNLSKLTFFGTLSNEKLIFYGKTNFFHKNYFFIKNIKILLNTNKKYNIIINIDTISYKEIRIKNINVYTFIKNNLLLIKLYFYLKIYNFPQEVNLNFFKRNYYLNGIKYMLFGLSRSLIKMNNNNWWINEKNYTNYNIFKFDLKNQKFIINELNIDFNNQKINFYSKYLNNNYNIIQGIFNNIKNYFFLSKKYLDNYNISKGLFLIEKYNSIFIFEIKIKIHNIYINNTYIRDIKININYNKSNKKYIISLIIKDKNKYILYLSGYIKNFLKKNEYINLKINFSNFPVIFFQKIIKNSFSDIRGKCNGIINLTGNYNNINYKGYLYIKNLGIKINNINTDYEFIGKSLILFKNKTIILKNLIIRDTKYNTIGYVNGSILNEKNNWIISIYIDSKNFLVINTNKLNNNFIYGTIFAKGKIHLLGDIDNININVINAKISNYSKLFIITNNNESNISNINFLNKKIKSNNTIKKENTSKKIRINIESNIDEKCDIQLFFNSNRNNFIKARGVGNILFKTNSLGKIEMLGKYYIKNGYYQLNNGNISKLTLNRNFKIIRGGTITWVGIPNNPKLNITASYSKSISNIEDYIKIPNYIILNNINSELIINIYGKLSEPIFQFNIDFPYINNNIKQKIIQKIYHRDERISQFVSIILLGKLFIKNQLLKKDFLFFSKKNNIFKYLVSKISNNDNTQIKLSIKNKKNIIKKIKYSFIYDINRFFSIKGILLFPNSYFYNQEKKYINGEFELNIDFNKKLDKNIKVILFSRSYNFYKENISKFHNIFFTKIYGGSIFYTISFEEIKDLLNVFFLYKKY